MTTVARIEAIPVSDSLAIGERFGSSRGLVPRRAAILVRLETTDGAVGWGEAWGGAPATKILIEELAEQLVGTTLSPSTNWLTDLLQRSYHYSSGGHLTIAASGIDIAMWDAFARSLGLPVHRLLGGPTRTQVPTYASTGYFTENNDLDQFRSELESAVKEGFPALKIKLGAGLASDRARSEIARDVFGPRAGLFVDFNGNYTADQALRSISALSDLDLGWVEEPVTPDDHDGLRLLRRCTVPLAAGEAVYTRYGFKHLIAERLVDIIQPDVSKCGGLSEARVIAHLAQTWNVRFSPHVWGGVVAQAASLQLLASVPRYPHTDNEPEPMWCELDRGRNALRDELAGGPLPRAGTEILIPEGPGLGIDIDEAALALLRTDR